MAADRVKKVVVTIEMPDNDGWGYNDHRASALNAMGAVEQQLGEMLEVEHTMIHGNDVSFTVDGIEANVRCLVRVSRHAVKDLARNSAQN